MIASASSDPASTCPLTSIARDGNAGIYREHTVAGMWTITGTRSSTLVATYKADKWIPSKRSQKSSKASAPARGTQHGKQHARLRHELVHGRGRAGKGEDRSDTAGGTGRAEEPRRDNEARKAATPKATETGHKRVKRRTKGKGNRRAKEGHTREACHDNEKARADTAQLVRTTAAVFSGRQQRSAADPSEVTEKDARVQRKQDEARRNSK
ncbi:hypothetical protein ERJ75_000700800 [Trypanosoma vivax]|nr:hypothetical protein ERJ75_000700800 [Trypanosoma vivax]